MPRVGDRVGSFTLLSPLPSGRRGERFLASSSISRDLSVVEVLSAEATSLAGFEAAFMSDGWVALSCQPDQRTVMRVYERGPSGGSFYVATEWLPGASVDAVLSSLSARRQRMDVALAVHVAIEVARALNSAHTLSDEKGQRRPVLHLRLRPEDVFLSMHGNVKIGGFGWPLERTVASTSLAFAAPEILRGGPVDTRADIYALGSVLNLMLSGEDPLDYGRSLAPSIASVAPDLVAIVRRAMDPDPGSRWVSTTALRTALQAWAKSTRIDLSSQTRALPELVRSVAPEAAEQTRPQTQWTQDDKTAVDPIDSSALRASLAEPQIAIAPAIVEPAIAPHTSPLPRGASGGFSLEAAGQTSLDPVDPALLRAMRDPQIAAPVSAPPWMVPDESPFGASAADPLPLARPAEAPSAFSGFDPNALSPAPMRAGFGNGHEAPVPFSSPAPRAPASSAPRGPSSPAQRSAPFNRPPPIEDTKTPALGTVIPPEARPPRIEGKWGGDTQEGVVEAETLRASMAKPEVPPKPTPPAPPAPQRGSSGWVDLLGVDAVGKNGNGDKEEKIELASEKIELATSKRMREEPRARPQSDAKPARPRGASELRPPPKDSTPGESRVGVILLAVVVIGAFFGIGLLMLGKL